MGYTNRIFTWDFDALKRFYEKYIVKWLNSAVSWTEAQKKQARANLGFGDGDAIVTTDDNASSDLDVADDNGNVLIQAKNGHIRTKNFDSSKDATTEERGLMSASDKIALNTAAQKLSTIEEGAEVNDVEIKDSESGDLDFSDDGGNVVMRLANGHIRSKKFDSSKIIESLMDYENVLNMPQNLVKSLVEVASEGKCTALYDDDGYPSLMHKIPRVYIGALAPTLGELTDIHPAFVVNEVQKECIYASVFLTSVYNGHYVSWFGLSPKGSITIPDLRVNISNKGNGWHLETIYERSLVVLLTMRLNSNTPTGNTKRGINHINTWEYCQLVNKNYIPGVKYNENELTGREYVNGTQPSEWSHNKKPWGIQDVIGGFHEVCDLMKLVNGKIYIAADNNFFKKNDTVSTFEDTWIDSGAAFDLTSGNNIVLNTAVNIPYAGDAYRLQNYNVIQCAEDYDSLSVDIRKKLALLLLAPRLSSSDTASVFPIAGRFGVNNNKPLCYGIFGGSQEYTESGLGSQIIAFPIDDNTLEGHNAHRNMGSRMFYIS